MSQCPSPIVAKIENEVIGTNTLACKRLDRNEAVTVSFIDRKAHQEAKKAAMISKYRQNSLE